MNLTAVLADPSDAITAVNYDQETMPQTKRASRSTGPTSSWKPSGRDGRIRARGSHRRCDALGDRPDCGGLIASPRFWLWAPTASPLVCGSAEHYRAGIDLCRPMRPNRKGAVERAIHYIAQPWRRTAAVGSLGEAQYSLDRFCVRFGDARRRGKSAVGDLADAEPLLAFPQFRLKRRQPQ